MAEELAYERQHDERDGGRIDEHEHGDGILDDGAEPHVGHGEREHGEDDCPDGVGDLALRYFGERLRAGGDKPDGGLEAGERDGDGEDDLPGAAEIMPCDLREGNAAVFGRFKQPARLRAHEDGEHIDDRHQNAGQNAGGEHVARDDVVILHTHTADDVNDHDAERKTCDGVHRAVAFNERRGESAGAVALRRFNGRDGCAGIDERCDDEHGEENEEQGVDDLADPDGDLARTQREKQHECEEHRREEQQREPFTLRAHQRREPSRKRHRCAAGDGKERPDGEVEDAGEENAVALADLAGERLQPIGMRDADGGDAEDGDTDGGDDKADDRGQDVAACHLTEMDGENEVARAEEHSEQRARHEDLLAEVEFFVCHGFVSFFFLTTILAEVLAKWKYLIIIDI